MANPSLGVLVRLIRHRSFVLLLLGPGGPSTVSRAVVPLVVRPTINGVFQTRPFSHVFNEVLELHPSFAYLDSKRHVVRTFLAAVLHRLPALVSRRNSGRTRLRVVPGVPMPKIWLVPFQLRTFLAGPWARVSAACAAGFAFSHEYIIQVIQVGGAL